MRRVVITGIGAVTPIGNSIRDYWNALERGVSGAVPITAFDASAFKTRFACEVKDFDIKNYMSFRESKRMDRFSQFAVIATEEAVENSGLVIDSINKDRAGVIWGSGIGGLLTFQQEVTNFIEGGRKPQFTPFFIPKMIIDLSAGHISMKYGFKGVNFSTVSACASATNAIIDAYQYIRTNIADVIITGGSEATIIEAGIGGFNALKALSTRNDSPETASRPFDRDRDGFVMGEGAGCLILEEYEMAKKRSAKIYAEIVGIGLSADAYHLTAPHPKGAGTIPLMINALKSARISSSQMGYVNVHGTSTPLGDMAEIKAIQKVFGEDSYSLNISSTKSMTGHLLGAAGGIEAIACLLAIDQSIIPPTINHFTQDPEIDSRLNLTLNEAQQRTVDYAMTNTFGFGGHNASIIFKKV